MLSKEGQKRDKELISILQIRAYHYSELVDYALAHFSGIKEENAKKVIQRFLKKYKSTLKQDSEDRYFIGKTEKTVLSAEEAYQLTILRTFPKFVTGKYRTIEEHMKDTEEIYDGLRGINRD